MTLKHNHLGLNHHIVPIRAIHLEMYVILHSRGLNAYFYRETYDLRLILNIYVFKTHNYMFVSLANAKIHHWKKTMVRHIYRIWILSYMSHAKGANVSRFLKQFISIIRYTIKWEIKDDGSKICLICLPFNIVLNTAFMKI